MNGKVSSPVAQGNLLLRMYIGADCMVSDEVNVQSPDQHGIARPDDMARINQSHPSIVIGQHVWIVVGL